ncbi:hypothetical protein [Parabacteroides sp. PF5-9]|uniref:hypothetical protein n=1 Tax=Parabacteroides sp. PF5-9 TaxID=1742404 RepID=UPI002473796C|nr:hypothetical protein [Parabacteroides sp. PF5-9]MDH6356768.1 hypothetical protein [Parabacteroides sp. PF5-9]
MKKQLINKGIAFILAILLQVGNLSAQEIRERIYLQTDKQLYLAGELLWMKLYLTDAEGIPLDFSKVGYVELVDETDPHIQAKVEINNGIGEGWMELPPSLSTGFYRLIAYTRYMRNEGEAIYFQRPISIINTFRNDEALQTDTLLFSEMPSALENTITVTTDSRTLPTRSQGQLLIQGIPENIHSLSLSVAGKDFVLPPNIITINQWNKSLAELPQKPLQNAFAPEYEGHIIQGKLVDIDSPQTPPGFKVPSFLGFVGDQIRLYNGQVNDNAEVSFYTNRNSGTHEIATSTYNLIGKKYRVDIQSPFETHTEKTLPPFIMNPKWEEQLLQRSVGLQAQYTFTPDSRGRIEHSFSHFQWNIEKSYLLDEYTRFTTMEEVIIEFIQGVTIRRSNNKRSLAVLTDDKTGYTSLRSLLVLDGIPILDHDFIFSYDPLLLKKIDVYRGKYVFGEDLFEGVVAMYSYNNDYPGLKLDETTQFFDYEGTQAKRLFYVPAQAETKRIPDFRHTLLWEPNVNTGGNTSISIPFRTSDITGEYQVTIEGLTKEGKVIRGTAYFDVK